MEKYNVSLVANAFGAPFGVARPDSAPIARGRTVPDGADAFGNLPHFPATAVVTPAALNIRFFGD